MTILFAGGEDSSFITVATTVSSNPLYYRPAFARCTIDCGNGGTTFPPSVYAATPLLGSLSSFWTHVRMANGSNNSATNNQNWISIRDAAAVTRIVLLSTATAGQFTINKRTAAGALTLLATSAAGTIPPCGSASVQPVAIDLFVNYSVSGQVKVFINGVVAADTGAGVDVTTDGATTVSQVLFAAASGSFPMHWSEGVVMDTSTLGVSLQTLPPVAAGNTQSWLPNTVGNINPTTINDANFVAATAANALSEWTVNTALPSGAWSILAVAQDARVSVGTSGPLNFEFLVRTVDGTDHVAGTTAGTTSFANYRRLWPVNPQTGAAWNAGELINAGIESLT